MYVGDWVERLYPYAVGALQGLDNDASRYYSIHGVVPIPDPADADLLLRRFDEALSALRANVPFSLQDPVDLELDVVSGFISRRLQEVGEAINDIAKVGHFEENPQDLASAVRPLVLQTISLVSFAGAINSDRGEGVCGDNAMTQLYFTNEVAITRAFMTIDDPVNDFLLRAHNSDLGAFGGALLAYTLAGECMDYELERVKALDFPESRDVQGYESFPARSLNLVAMRGGDLPSDFWETFFDTAYGTSREIPGIFLAGTYEWAEQTGFLNLYAELAEKDPRFFDQLRAHIGNKDAFFVELFPDYRISLGPDLSM